MAKVAVVSSCLVKMANSNATSMSRLELTPWDWPFLPLNPIQKGLLFHKPESEQLQETLINHLKSSLSRTLDFFPPLAGRLTAEENDGSTTGYFVDCNNDGAEFAVAVAENVSVSDILVPEYIPKIVWEFFLLNNLSNYEGTSKPLLAVQVTQLVDGLFIACTANHAVLDGTSFWRFFNSWSEIARGLETISKIPVFERFLPSKVTKDNPLPKLDNYVTQDYVRPPLLERIFHFSKEAIAKLKTKAHAEAGIDKISSLQAVSAHIWPSYVRCRSLSRSSPEACFMMLVGARARIPLPDGYFGNAVYIPQVSVCEEELLQNGFGYAARKINEFVAQQTREEMMKFLKNKEKRSPVIKEGRSSLVISSSPRHNVYGNDFGWGKPITVRSGEGQKFDGKVTVYTAAEPGGMDAEVCFSPETLEAMGGDEEFMDAFTV